MSTELQTLSPEDCYRLVAAHPVHVGRIAVVDDGVAHVLPVNYRLDGEDVILRTDPGTRVYGAAIGHAVTFEVDAVDPTWQEGWSVVVHGDAEQVLDEGELARLRQLPLRSWAGADKEVFVRIRARQVTGRRIV
jgi:uncharacterized protein